MTTEEFLNITFSSDEIIETALAGNYPVLDNINNITEIAAFGKGRCFLLEVPKDLGHSSWNLLVSLHVSGSIYFIEKGQEMCLIYNSCPSQLVVAHMDKDNYLSMTKIRAVKKIISDG